MITLREFFISDRERLVSLASYELEGVLKSEVRKNGRYFDLHQFARAAR
jgi:hypothetical protein